MAGVEEPGRVRECPLVGLMIGSDLRPLCQFQCVFDINAKVADRALNLRMTEQDSHRA
jgi:hypothetical protein